MAHGNEDKALKNILQGKNPDKKIQSFAWDDKDPVIVEYRKQKAKEKEEQEERNAMLRELRMPMFCPECDYIMNNKLDTKFWNRRRKCFECTVKDETQMRIAGTYEAYEKRIMLENKRSWLLEQITQIEEYTKEHSLTFFNQITPDGHNIVEEKWDINTGNIAEKAAEAINEFKAQLEAVTAELLEV